MHTVRRGWRLFVVAGLVALGLAATVRADQAPLDKTLVDTLRDVHNRGADLYNGGDPAGCYRLFQGALMTVRPLLGSHAELQKDIDKALADTDQQADVARRAFALHTAIENVRAKLKGGGAAKPPEPKPGAKPPEPMPKPPEPKPPEPQPMARTLWERLGGEAIVKKVVDDLAAAAMPDPKVDFSRGGKYKPTPAQSDDIKSKLVDLISEASGGPRKYTGKSMKEVHRGMGITDAQFNALAGHLVDALKKNGVKQEDIDAAMKVFEATRKDIVETKPPEPKPEEKKSPETAEIKGKVVFQGKPLPGGTVTFIAANGNVPHTADIAADGTFAVKDVPPGEYRVAVKGKDVQVPAKFSEADKSGLVYTAVKGAQTFDIMLMP